jgi:UDPglucose 6-dehydrogenase
MGGEMKAISIFGLGYVGLCTAVCFVDRGFRVVGVDVDEEKVKLLAGGKSPIYEPGLEPMLKRAVEKGTSLLTTDAKSAIDGSDVSFITVGTPSRSDGSIDLGYIKSAARDVGSAMKNKADYHLVVVKSTVTPGTTQKLVKPFLEKFSSKSCGRDFGLCMNPEFLQEGDAIRGVLEPDRIVIGEFDRRSGDVLEKIYRDFYREKMPPLVRTNLETAEIIKYANNAFLATKISFINLVAGLCEKVEGANVELIARAIGLDHRINPRFLKAGAGFGGSCFPKDVRALVSFSREFGLEPSLLEDVLRINERQALRIVGLARERLGSLGKKHVAILGLSFKPKTDDIRDAPSIKIISRLLEEGTRVIVYDPAGFLGKGWIRIHPPNGITTIFCPNPNSINFL